MLHNSFELKKIIDTCSNEWAREGLQHNIDSIFTVEEQSILWQCMEDKTDDMQDKLNSIIRRNLSSDVPEKVYRGVSKRTLAWLSKLTVGDRFAFDRVMSFSADYKVARNFASFNFYGTKNIICINDAAFAFNYQEIIMQLILAAPDCEFNGFDPQITRVNNLNLVNDEDEFMFPTGTTLRVDSIEYNKPDYKIWNVSIVY